MNSHVLPLAPTQHIIFCVLSILFFLIQYLRQGHKYQLLTVFAIAGTFLIYANPSKMFFYGIGIFEMVMMVLIFITLTMEKKKSEKLLEATAEKVSQIKAEEALSEDTGTDSDEEE